MKLWLGSAMNNSDQRTLSLSIMFAVGSLFKRSSGPFLTTLQTAQELRGHGHQIQVLGTRSSRDIGPPSHWAGIHTVAFPKIGPSTLHFAPRAGHWLRRCNLRPDVVSLEGVWLHLFGKIAQWARRQKVPYLITPHGNFNPFALRISSWKKSLARTWFADHMLRHAACFHAITEQEYQWIRDYGLRQPVCLIPNGVHTPSTPVQEFPPEFQGSRTALYIGRLHQIKGLDLLLKAWEQVAGVHPDWQLIIAGNDDGAQRDLLTLRSSLRLERSVHFVGPVHGEIKAAWLANCDFFILPSRSEGLAMAPLEAMSYGKPVLLTITSNFPEAAESGAAYEVACDVPGIQQGLRMMMNNDDAQRTAMGAAGRAMVRDRYNWRTICSELEQVYGWLAGRNAAPASVRFD
jgi:glycosyltransferase involved in cell wall biosynthesis